MLRVPVQSRKGNLALVVLGVVYSLGALTVLAWFAVEVHNAAAALDRLIQMSLIASAICGLWFIANALQNLGVRASRRGLAELQRRSSAAH